jgi:hypothetical protein
MSLLHQCNNCKRTQPSELPIKIEMAHPTVSDPPDMEFCTWLCVYDYSGQKVNSDPSARDQLIFRADGGDSDRVDGTS